MAADTSTASGFYFYSFGVVAEDKEGDSDLIKVSLMETMPLLKGRLKDYKVSRDVTSTDHRGVESRETAEGVGFVVATWLGWEGGNRQTAPNVYEGESVLLMRYGTDEDIYWVDIGREPSLRRLENVIYAWSNLSNKGETYSGDTSYFLRVSTKDKYIHLHTSRNDGEKAAFDIIINTNEGTLDIQDDMDNSLKWDAVNGTLNGQFREEINLRSRKILLEATESITETAPTIQITGGQTASMSSPATTVTGTATINVGGGIMSLSAQQVNGSAGGGGMTLGSADGQVKVANELIVNGTGRFSGVVYAQDFLEI